MNKKLSDRLKALHDIEEKMDKAILDEIDLAVVGLEQTVKSLQTIHKWVASMVGTCEILRVQEETALRLKMAEDDKSKIQ